MTRESTGIKYVIFRYFGQLAFTPEDNFKGIMDSHRITKITDCKDFNEAAECIFVYLHIPREDLIDRTGDDNA